MHPLFTQPIKLIAVISAWLTIIAGFIFFQQTLIGGSWTQLIICSGPPMVLLFFIILSNYFLARAIQFQGSNNATQIAKHLFTALIIVTLWSQISRLYCHTLQSLSNSELWIELFDASIIIYASAGLIFYFVGLLLHYLYLENQYLHQLEQQALDNKLLAARSELNNLKMSIHPHFLFNSFTALHTLISTNPVKASEVTLQLTDFLRRSLNYAKNDWTTISEELEHINAYLSIEKVRLAERLNLDFHIDETVLKKYLPPFTLLPLLENAVKHGIEQMVEGGTIQLSILDEGHSLLITTSNPLNPNSANKNQNGFGLHSLQKRLSASYSKKVVLNIKRTDTNFTISFRLPVLEQPQQP